MERVNFLSHFFLLQLVTWLEHTLLYKKRAKRMPDTTVETTLNVLKTAILCVVFWKAQEQFVANRRLSLNFGASFLGNGKAYNDDRLSS